MSVSVFFEDLHVITTTIEYSYSIAAFLSDFGGVLGLFLVVSFRDLIETGMVLLYELKKKCLSTKCKKEGENEYKEFVKMRDTSEQNEK